MGRAGTPERSSTSHRDSSIFCKLLISQICGASGQVAAERRRIRSFIASETQAQEADRNAGTRADERR